MCQFLQRLPNAIVVAVCLVTLSFHSQINSTTTFAEAQTFPMTALYLTWNCYLAMDDARVTEYHVVEAVVIVPMRSALRGGNLGGRGPVQRC